MIDFSAYDDDYDLVTPFDTESPEILKDGDYEFVIAGAVVKEIKGKAKLELKLTVASDGEFKGATISNLVSVNDRDAVGRLGFVLKGFGFDSDNWKKANGRTFNTEFPKALRWLIGMRVKARKKTNIVPPAHPSARESTFHNINFRGRSDVDDGLPRSIGPEQLNQSDPNAKDDPFAPKVGEKDPFSP